MPPKAITFTKTYQQRILAYKTILCSKGSLAASDVRKEWSYYAEVILEPSGWQALWKITRRKCDELGVSFPTVMFVMVKSIDAEAFTAEVQILDNPEGLDISSHQEASLINLYPTVTQEHKLMYTYETADFLDNLRFFYDFVWRPWDVDDDDKEDWVTAHLEKRMKFYEDMQSGRVVPETVKHIESLLMEARSLNFNIEKLESEIEDKDDDDVEASVFCELMDLHGRMDQIQKEFEMHEDPQMRNLLLMKKQYNRQSLSRSLESRYNQNVYIIWSGGSISSYIELLKTSKPHISDEASVRPMCKLQEALDQAVPGDSVLLSAGSHDIVGLGEFEKGGCIKGISIPELTKLAPNGAGNVLLNCTGGEIVLENITIDVQQLQIAIASCDTTMRINNCHIIGSSGSSTSEGILGLHYAKITLQDCHISGFGTGVVVHSGSEVSLISCKIDSCRFGIMVFNGGKLDLQRCTICNCSEYGVKVEIYEQNLTANKVGCIGLLNSVGQVAVRESSVLNNTKGDVCVIQTHTDAGYDADSPTFSFVLCGEGQSTSTPNEKKGDMNEPISKIQENINFAQNSECNQKESTVDRYTALTDTAGDMSTFNTLSLIQEEQENCNGNYINTV